MICVRQVVEHAEIDGENADSSNAHSDSWYNPMNARCTCPAEHEQANGHARAFDASKVQAALGCVDKLSIPACDFFLVDGQYGCDQCTHTHGCEDGVGLLQREAVIVLEDEGDGGKGQVQDGPGECYPEGKPEYDGFSEEEVEGSVEETPIMVLSEARSSSDLTFQRMRWEMVASGFSGSGTLNP